LWVGDTLCCEKILGDSPGLMQKMAVLVPAVFQFGGNPAVIE